MTTMRAKMRVADVHPYVGSDGKTSQETLTFYAVGPKGSYPADGSDENNSYARWSPSGRLELSVANPALWGKFAVGDEYYLDFTLAAEAPKPEAADDAAAAA